MTEQKTMKSAFKWYDPVPLTISIIVVTTLAMFILQAISGNGTIPWRAVAAAILFYSIANQVSGLLSKRWVRYLLISYTCFIAIMVVLLWVAGSMAQTPLSQLFYMRRIYVLLVLFYILETVLAVVFRVLLMIIKGEMKI